MICIPVVLISRTLEVCSVAEWFFGDQTEDFLYHQGYLAFIHHVETILNKQDISRQNKTANKT